MELEFSLRGLLVGIPVVGVVFCGAALWVTAHFDESDSPLGLGTILGHTLSSPLFWVVSIAAFAASYHFAV
jgi:hypothetical protein